MLNRVTAPITVIIACLAFLGCAQHSSLSATNKNLDTVKETEDRPAKYSAAQQSDEQKPAASKPDFALVKNSRFANIKAANTQQKKDLAAILAMQGEYKVAFHFNETVILKDDYKRMPEKDAGAFETVMLIEQSDDKVVLQHILVMPNGHVVKHWRQDWHYETAQRFEFIQDQTWQLKNLPKHKIAGHWTQCVYEVSDAPRYCGTGKWNHEYGVSTWTSDRSWRPLPRREYTVRDDYNALNVENRHTVTPLGWTHEQDNTKVKRVGSTTEETLVREFGFNDYQNISGYDFAPAYDYWEKTDAYWMLVRKVWSERLHENHSVVINTDVDGMPIITATFAQAEKIRQGEEAPSAEAVHDMLAEWVSSLKTVNSRVSQR